MTTFDYLICGDSGLRKLAELTETIDRILKIMELPPSEIDFSNVDITNASLDETIEAVTSDFVEFLISKDYLPDFVDPDLFYFTYNEDNLENNILMIRESMLDEECKKELLQYKDKLSQINIELDIY